MQKINNLLNNNSGVILVTVVMLAIVLSFVAVGIISINVSHSTSSSSVVDSVRAEQLATGEFYRMHQLRLQGCPNPPCGTAGDCSTCPDSNNETLNNKSFAFTHSSSTIGNLEQLNIIISYP